MRWLCFSLILTFSAKGLVKPIEIDFSTGQGSQSSVPQDAVSRVLVHALEQINATKLVYDFVPLSRARELQLVKAGENLCLYNKVKNAERQQFLYYSRFPISVFPPNRLIIKQPNQLQKQVELTQVLDNTNLRIGVADGRSYGQRLDDEIRYSKDKLFTLAGVDVDMRLMKMVLENKLDGMIDFSGAFFSRKQFLGEVANINFSVHALNSAQQFVFGYVACVKTDTGRQVIDLIDNSLQKPIVYGYMKKLFKEQFPKEESPFVIQELDRVFGKQ